MLTPSELRRHPCAEHGFKYSVAERPWWRIRGVRRNRIGCRRQPEASARADCGRSRPIRSGRHRETGPNFSIGQQRQQPKSRDRSDCQYFRCAGVNTANIALVSQDLWGGPDSEHQGVAVAYADGHLYLSYNNGAETQYDTSDNAEIVAFNTAPSGATNRRSHIHGIKATSSVSPRTAAKSMLPARAIRGLRGYGRWQSGEVDLRPLPCRWRGGHRPQPGTGHTANNFFSYRVSKSFQNVVATTQGGNTILYAFGSGQPQSYGGYIIAEYSSSGTLLTPRLIARSASNPGGSAPMPRSIGTAPSGWSATSSIRAWVKRTGMRRSGQPAMTSARSPCTRTIRGCPQAFNGVATIGSELYAVGYANVGGGQDYLVAEYNTDGSVAWSETFGAAGTTTR